MSSTQPDFAELLDRAVTEPGAIQAAYTAFYGYSLGNQLLAFLQCKERGIPVGPIATFNGWKTHNRYVKRGEKALVLCMPITGKKIAKDDEEEDSTFTRFVYRPNWFALAQTDGAEFVPPALVEWDLTKALSELDVTEVEFEHIDGNVQGYARQRTIAVSPVAGLPHKTRFHELAHVVLGHTTEDKLTDDDTTPRNIREVEAEAVALLCLESLGLPGSEFARGYIQHWNQGSTPIEEKSAKRIFKAADAILKAGRPV